MSQKIYRWEEWFARRRFVLRRGLDYFCSQASISQQVRNAASAMGVRVSIVEGIDLVTVFVAPHRERKDVADATVA